MPFVANTPESLIGRTDSKNPNCTCRGITASGRPCRRPLAAAGAYLIPPRRPKTPDPRDERLYCWQHKEQASISAHSSPGPRANATPILEEGPRTSLDTLTDRLGLVDLQDKEKQKRRKDPRLKGQYPYATSHNDQGFSRPAGKNNDKKPQLEFCFCFTIPLDEVSQPTPARPQPRPVQRPTAPIPPRKSKSHVKSSTISAAKSSRKSQVSQVSRAKDVIPNDLDTATASALLAELAKPYAESEEAGYIYMFWLTPETSSRGPNGNVVPADAARALLAPPSPSPRTRRPSDVVSSFADKNRGSKKTMVLKIGRAANVQRRMNQWQRQCGRDVEVLRYYPYAPTVSSAALATPPRTTPHARRVERLIHIELGGRGLRADEGTCSACGREHREWFEVEASRPAVRQIDGVIRRWIEWDGKA